MKVPCSYCKEDMTYGQDHTTIALHISFTKSRKNPLVKVPENYPKSTERQVCWNCWLKMLDWLAKESGCVSHG